MLSTSDHVDVYGNDITWGQTQGIHAVLESFYDGTRGHLSMDNYFHDNRVKLTGGGHAASIAHLNSANPNIGTHRYEGNSYILPSASAYFHRAGVEVTLAQWHAAGYS